MAAIDHDPGVVDRLVTELRDRPRPVSDLENALLLHRQVDLHNGSGKATRDLAQAFDDGREGDVVREQRDWPDFPISCSTFTTSAGK